MKFRKATSCAALIAAALLAEPALAQAPAKSYPGETAFRALYKEMVESNSSASGECTTLVEKVAVRMKAAGFPASDIHLLAPTEQPMAGNIVAVYPGSDPNLKPVLLLAHISVVEAKRDEWERDPFTLFEEGGYFYGRGTSDDKAQAAIWADSLIRFHQEGYKPRRTIKMALTCGHDNGGKYINGAGWLARNHRQLIDAGFALNEGGGGMLNEKGEPIAQTVLAATKRGMSFIVRANNPGGHSSRPRPDNALYSLARALDKLSQHHFPVQFNEYNRAYFTEMAKIVGGEDGAAMTTLIANPSDPLATARLNRTVLYYNLLRTTCIPVLAEAGHAGNALPQRAQATLNCRVRPEMSMQEVHSTLVKWIDDPEIQVIPPARDEAAVPQAPLTPEVMNPIRRASAQVFPGVPVIPWMGAGGTDASQLNPVGIPTYGVSGLFRDPDGGRAHGLNERIRVKSLMEGREFLHRLVKGYGDERK